MMAVGTKAGTALKDCVSNEANLRVVLSEIGVAWSMPGPMLQV